MISRRLTWILVALILGGMLALMWRPIVEDSATIDESEFIGAGYSYWQGQGYRFDVEHPPLAQLWNTVPTLWLDVKVPPGTERYWEQPSPIPIVTTWKSVHIPRDKFGANPPPFYVYPHLEAGLFGQELLFRGANDADSLLKWCRLMQALLALLTGVLIFIWARSLSNDVGGFLALLTWALNPLALGYGHIVATDGAVALTSLLAIWSWVRFFQKPQVGSAVVAGMCFGVALLTKYTALMLAPICVVLAVIHCWRQRSWKPVLKFALIVPVLAYLLILVVYLPYLSPPPPIDAGVARQLEVPDWFRTWRTLLIPGDYFRGLTIMLTHIKIGHDGYLLGEWSTKGWWYYYPLAILWKTPVALLLLILIALACLFCHRNGWMPLLAGAIFLGLALLNRANIGIRHILPLFPLLSVFIGAQLGTMRRGYQIAGWILCGWLLVVALVVRPGYLAYFNEFVGGSGNGRYYLLDSNLDWGQDAKRLRAYVMEKKIIPISGVYFGPRNALGYYRVPFVPLAPADLPGLHQTWVAISAHRLMRPEFEWLRNNHQPSDRVGDTIYIYWLP